MRHAWLGLLVAVGMMLGAVAPASAQSRRTRVTSDRVTLGASLGYGFRITDEGDLDDDANPYGLGLGARVGYTVDSGLYLGGLFNYFVGESVGNDSVNGRLNQLNVAGVAGYDIAFGQRAVLRPGVGVGATVVTGEVCVAGECIEDRTDPYLLVAPSLELIISIGSLYFGGEARYMWLPDDEIPDGALFGVNVGALL